MKIEEFRRAVAELGDVCRKHGIVIRGECLSEPVAGVIGLYDSDDTSVKRFQDHGVRDDGDGGIIVDRIG